MIVDVAIQLVRGASPAISRFGLDFLTASTWKPNFGIFGAVPLVYGTAVTSAMALMLATPIADLTARTVHAYFVGLLAKRLDCSMQATTAPGQVQLTVIEAGA